MTAHYLCQRLWWREPTTGTVERRCLLRTVERKYGKASRVWIFDRRVVSEGNLAAIRKRKREYRVGTTRSKLKRFDLSLKILAGFEINSIEGARQHSAITPTVFSVLWLALVSRSFASSVTAGYA